MQFCCFQISLFSSILVIPSLLARSGGVLRCLACRTLLHSPFAFDIQVEQISRLQILRIASVFGVCPTAPTVPCHRSLASTTRLARFSGPLPRGSQAFAPCSYAAPFLLSPKGIIPSQMGVADWEHAWIEFVVNGQPRRFNFEPHPHGSFLDAKNIR